MHDFTMRNTLRVTIPCAGIPRVNTVIFCSARDGDGLARDLLFVTHIVHVESWIAFEFVQAVE